MKILVLEDQGIKREEFERLAQEHEIFWYDDEFEKKEIETAVVVKKRLSAEELNEYPNLKLFAVAFTGYDNVDLELYRSKGIAVCNVPEYSTSAVTELTVGLAISLLREIPKADKTIREGGWDLGRAGSELSGKTVGICGTGAIGTRAAEIFSVFGCRVIGWSRSRRPEFERCGTYVDTLDQLCTESDILSVHVPSNKETKGIIGSEQLSKMKASAYLINTARGPVIDENALYEALISKRIAGAALDVYSVEPVSEDNPLLKLDNVILTPHIAYRTEEALKNRAKITFDNIHSFANGGKLNRVD